MQNYGKNRLLRANAMNDHLPHNVGIYSPYLSIMGGGERYLLTIADALSEKQTVTVFGSADHKEQARKQFALPLTHVHFLTNHPIRERRLWKKYPGLRAYSMFFYMTDGSLFFPMSKKNFLIIQSPDHIPPPTFFNMIKGQGWQLICYSQFMQAIIKKRTRRSAAMLPPAIDTSTFSFVKQKKEKCIVTVGRFFPYPHNKKQDVLIQSFTSAYKTHFQGWKLIVAGGLTEHGGDEIVQRLMELAKGYPVEIKVNLPFADLKSLYQRATVYWHAAGYGEDLNLHPERAEHFGITTLEAMASGAVPVVFDGGGQKDIVEDGKSGYLWQTTDELVEKTTTLIREESEFAKLQSGALARVQDFSMERFRERLKEIVT